MGNNKHVAIDSLISVTARLRERASMVLIALRS